MTIEYISEVPKDESLEDRLGNRSPVREFDVKTVHTVAPIRDSELMLDLVFRARPDLVPFAPHPSNPSAFVDEPRLKRVSRWLWRLTVSYSSELTQEELEAKELQGEKRDPTNYAAKISVAGWNEPQVITLDIHGKPIANLAQDPFPNVEDKYESLEIAVEKNVRVIKPEWLLDYPNSINKEEMRFLGIRFPPETLLMTSPTVGHVVEEKGIRYFPFGYKLTYRREGWRKKLLNTGLRERYFVSGTATIDVDPTKLIKIVDEKGEPVDEPVFLDKRGRAYRQGAEELVGGNVPLNDLEIWPAPSYYKRPLRGTLTQQEIITLEFEVKRILPFKKLPHR